jgi:hypothetical protein
MRRGCREGCFGILCNLNHSNEHNSAHQTIPTRKGEWRRNTTYALVALAPSIALTIVKSSSFICATMVLGAKTPAANSAPPNSVPAAYSETNDGIVVLSKIQWRGIPVLCVLQVGERNTSTCELVNKERDAHSVCEMMMVVEDVNGRGDCRFISPSLVQYSGSITVLVGVEFKMKAEKMKSSAGVQV